MVDPISDMLTRIRNAQKAKHKVAVVPASKIKLEIAKILKKENYIEDFKKSDKNKEKILEINLKYPSTINELKKVSKPGQRIYVKSKKIKPVKNGYGISVFSTSKGLMTGKEAKKSGLGGEALLEVW